MTLLPEPEVWPDVRSSEFGDWVSPGGARRIALTYAERVVAGMRCGWSDRSMTEYECFNKRAALRWCERCLTLAALREMGGGHGTGGTDSATAPQAVERADTQDEGRTTGAGGGGADGDPPRT